MENPATWTEAEHVVRRVLNEWAKLPSGWAGLSLERQVTDALREAGFIAGTSAKQDATKELTTAKGGTATEVPSANARTLAWGAFVKQGFMRDWPQEQAEVAFLAFAAGIDAANDLASARQQTVADD